MLEEKWVSAPLENVDMKKLNLNFFYQLGSYLIPLTGLTTMPDEFDEWSIVHNSRGAKSSIERLIAAYPELPMCKSAALDFLEHLDYYIKWYDKRSAERDGEKVTSGCTAFYSLEESAKAFEAVLLTELQNLGAFYVTGKRAYDTLKLIDHFEETLSAATLSKVNKEIVEEINQSGRCLAFDCYTACGFHILRATEAVLHQYYIVVCKPKTQKPLGSWSEYVGELYKIEDNEVKKVHALIQQIKYVDRNPIMHPEWVLTQDEAIAVFDSAKAAIEMMANKLPDRRERGKGKIKSSQT